MFYAIKIMSNRNEIKIMLFQIIITIIIIIIIIIFAIFSSAAITENVFSFFIKINNFFLNIF